MNRDKRGRFAPGHTLGRKGWEGLVNRRFDGNEQAAKEYFGIHARWRYRMQTGIVRRYAFQHPGRPSEFMQRWNAEPLNQEIQFMEASR